MRKKITTLKRDIQLYIRDYKAILCGLSLSGHSYIDNGYVTTPHRLYMSCKCSKCGDVIYFRKDI